MNTKLNLILALLTVSLSGSAQELLPAREDEPIYINPGIYLTFKDFISNNPIDRSHIQADLDVVESEYYYFLAKKREITITKDDSVFTIKPGVIWGYSDGRNLYLSRALFQKSLNEWINSDQINPWIKVVKIETLSLIYFVTMIQYNNGGSFYNAYTHSTTTYPGSSGKTTEEKKYILSTKDGKLYTLNMENLKILIADDPELASELKKSRDKNEIKLYTFLRKYNERHPIKLY